MNNEQYLALKGTPEQIEAIKGFVALLVRNSEGTIEDLTGAFLELSVRNQIHAWNMHVARLNAQGARR